jgi:hypothetical protein
MKHLLRWALVMMPALAFSQSVNDAQFWENIYLEKNISKKWIIHLNHEGRITDNISRFNYGYLDGGVTWKYKKSIRFSADYVFVRKRYFDGNIANRHQVYGTVTLRKKLGDLFVSDRNMMQWEWQNPFTSVGGRVPELYYRNKLTLRYDKWALSPYVAAEHYFSLVYYDAYGPQFDRGRYYLGAFYALSSVSAIEVYSMMEKHFNVNEPETNWVIGIGFEHAFYSGGLTGKW